MKILDFNRSFIVFEMDREAKPPKTMSDFRQNSHNRARIQIDSRCQITDRQGKSTNYFLGASCKTERVGVGPEVGLFIQPNADFRPVMSEEHAVLFKSWDRNDKGVMLQPASLGPQPERQVVLCREAFYRHSFRLAHAEATHLPHVPSMIEAADQGRPLIARTEYEMAGYGVLLEYPILTFNVSEKHQAYQTDTGPVVFPDLNRPHECVPDTLRLAFSAFNAPNWIEFIVQEPTPVGNGISVNHYSRTEQIIGCRNAIFSLH